MEWFNIHYCEAFGHDAGVHITLEDAEKLGREGAAFAGHVHSFEGMGKLTIEETKEVDPLYKQLSKGADTPELKALGEDLLEHENAMRDWLKSELDGESDGAAKVFAYLERQGIARRRGCDPAETKRPCPSTGGGRGSPKGRPCRARPGGLERRPVLRKRVWGHEGYVPGYHTLTFATGNGRKAITLEVPEILQPDQLYHDVIYPAYNQLWCQG